MPSMSTQVQNADIAAVMREIADLLEIKDENPFRIRAKPARSRCTLRSSATSAWTAWRAWN